jgi:hypothetical protein
MKKILGVVVLAAVLLAGCTSAEMSKIGAIGGSQHVTLYSNSGAVLGQWDSDGTVHNEENSDGLYFTDKSNGKLVRIAGTFIVTQN